MKFERYQKLAKTILMDDGMGGIRKKYVETRPREMNPLVLAYVGDAYFHLYVRLHLLSYEQSNVQLLHGLAAKMVSAVWQAKAYRAIEPMLEDFERAIYRRARNHKSHAARAASYSDYHASTGFEALLGYHYLEKNEARLKEIVSASFDYLLREMASLQGGKGAAKKKEPARRPE